MPVACRLVPRESGSGDEYAVINTDNGAVEHRHGDDQDACRAQAAAINASTENSDDDMSRERAPESMAPARLRVTKHTPVEYHDVLRALESDNAVGALKVELGAIKAWRARARAAGGRVGRFAPVDLLRAQESCERALEQLVGVAPTMDESEADVRSSYVPRRREGGIHAHRLDGDGGAEFGGAHRHAFLYKGVMYMTEKDGEHEHDSAEGTELAGESEHTHRAFVPGPDGKMLEVAFEAGTEHTHEKLTGVTVHDGLHEHEAKVEGADVKTLTPEEFRAMFGAVESVQIDGELTVSTGGLELRDWWADGEGAAEAREALARYAVGEAVELEAMGEPMFDSEAAGYYAVVTDSYELVADLTDGDLERAVESAVALVTRERPRLILAGPPGRCAAGGRSYRPAMFRLELIEQAGRARESLVCRAVESTVDPWGGRVLEAAGDDLTWELVVIEFGLSNNGNFWPNTMAEELARAFEGVPIEEIQYSPMHRDHLFDDRVLRRFPGGATGNFVGLVDGLKVAESAGGKALGKPPTGKALEAIAKVATMTPDEVIAASSGGIVGVARFDKNDKGRNVDAQLRTAESSGHLANYLGVSIDASHAPFTPVHVPGMRRPVRVRTAVDKTDRCVVTLATRPSAGGAFTRSIAA